MSSTVGRNSLIMASGTIASRVTGQIRTIALVGALGTTGIAANAYQAGAQIPQVIFNLISTGVFNAVLVPQIVRTLKERDAEERLSKLITMAMVMLALITAIMMAATPVLTSIYVGSGWTPAQRALANAFTLWCMPQIFFYGLYTIIGQILAASGRFAAYAWSSVGANVVSCAGFGAFILLFGNAAHQPMDFWTADKVALTAGAWTAGVAFQALILFIPLVRVGLHYHVRFGLRGLGLRSMGRVAAWSIAMVFINQLMGIVNSRVTTGAPAAGGDLFGIAGNASYQYAYTLYILPYSVIAASIATAMFPRLSKAVGERRIDHARAELSSALRTNGVAMCFFVAAMMAMPVAVTKALIPSTTLHGALLISGPLMGLLIGLIPISAFLFVQRAFYAWEDGRSPFLFALVENLVQVAMLLALMQVLPPQHWTTLVAVSLSASYIVTFPWVLWMLRRRFEGHMDGRRIAGTYLRCMIAGVGAWAAGSMINRPVTRLVGADTDSTAGHLGWGQSIVICILVGVVTAVVYAVLLWLLRVEEFTSMVRGALRRVKRAPVTAAEAATKPSADATAEPASKTTSEAASSPVTSPVTSAMPTARMTTASHMGTAAVRPLHHGAEGIMTPQLGDTLFNRYTLVSSLRESTGLAAWKVNDRVLARDCQAVAITVPECIDQVDALAASLTISRNDRFTPVQMFQRVDDCALLIMRPDAGVALSEYLRGPNRDILSFEAIRSIIGDTAYAMDSTHESAQLSTDTIRVSARGVSVADAPLLPLLAEPTAAPEGVIGEQLVVRQLAAVMVALLTRTPSQNLDAISLDMLPADTPAEFRVIIARGLGLQSGDQPAEPMMSINELKALLGYWSTVPELGGTDIVFPSVDGVPSVELVALAPMDNRDIADLPASLVTSERLPLLNIAGTEEPDAQDVAGGAAGEVDTDDDGSSELSAAVTTASMKIPTLAVPQVTQQDEERSIFPVQTTPDSLFREFGSSDSDNNSLGHMATLPIDVSALHHPAGPGEATTRIPVFGSQTPLSVTLNQAEEAAQATAAAEAPEPAVPAAQPPSFTPAEPVTPDEGDTTDLSDTRLFGRFTTRAVAMIAAALVMVLALVIALVSLNANDNRPKDTDQNGWPDSPNLDQVPFGDEQQGSSKQGQNQQNQQNQNTQQPSQSDQQQGAPQADADTVDIAVLRAW